LHFGKLKKIYLHLFRSTPFTPYFSTAQQAYFVPHTLAFFLRFRYWYALFFTAKCLPHCQRSNGSHRTFSKRKKNKKASKIRWLRTMPTLNKKSQRLRHNGKANKVLRKIGFVALPPFGTYSVSFWIFCHATY